MSFHLKDNDAVKDVPSFYKEMGFSSYAAIDLNGDGTTTHDLNVPLFLEDGVEGHDLVTNNGTGEHIFNQSAVFETAHNMCKVGGVMLHVLPWINWRNHGFYNFHPNLFYDLAKENGYKFITCYGARRDGTVVIENISVNEDKKPDGLNINVSIVVSLRKTNDDPFKTPTQSKYRKAVKGKPEPGNKASLDTVLDHLKPESVVCYDEPYPMIVGQLDDYYFECLKNIFPVPEDIVSGREMGNNILLQRAAREVLADESTFINWRQFFEAHTSTAFLQEVVRSFGPHVMEEYPHLTKLDLQAGVRFRDEAPFSLDCQFAVNTPVTKKGTVRGPHIDDTKELFGGMIYVDGGGELEIHEWKNGRKFTGRKGMKKKAECVKGSTKVVRTVKCKPGTVVLFLNTPDAIHAVAPRKRGDGFRTYINLVGEVAEPLFELK